MLTFRDSAGRPTSWTLPNTPPSSTQPQFGAPGTVYAGGTPNFNEATGQQRTPATPAPSAPAKAPDMSAYGRAQPVQPPSMGTPYGSNRPQPTTMYAGGTPNFNEATGQPANPYANMQPGVYGMDGRLIPGDMGTAINTANQQQAALVQLLNQRNAPLSFFGNGLGMDMGPQTPDMQSMLKQAQQMVAGGWQNPMQRYFEEADAAQQRALRQPPQQEAIRQPSFNRNAIQDLFTQNNIQAPQGFLDQLIGLLGGNAPQPQLPSPGLRPAPGAPDSYYPGFDPRTQDQYGRPTPRPIAPQQGLTYADYMRAGSPGVGQIQTNDFMQWDDEKGNLIQGSPTAKAAYEQWAQSQKAPRAVAPAGGQQDQRGALHTNMPDWITDPSWRKTWGMPALPGRAQPIQPPGQGTPYRQPESVSLAEQRFDLEDVDEAAFNVLRFAARGHYVDDDDYSKAYSEYLQNYKALKPYGREGTKISYRDFANRASKLRDIYTQENAIAEQKDKAARAAAKNAQTRSGLDARVQKFVAWSDDWRSAGDFWNGLMPIERAELTAAGIGTTELEALINKHRKAGRGGSELKKHMASSNRPPIPTPEQAAMLSRYATGETGFEAAIRASGWTGPLIYTGPWS